MTMGGIGAIQDRIGKITAQIAQIEQQNPMHRANGASRGANRVGSGSPSGASPSAVAFKNHLAAQTMQTLSGASQPGASGAGGLGGGLGNGLGSGLGGGLGQAGGFNPGLGKAGLSGLGAAGSNASLTQSLSALLQAGALSQQGQANALPVAANGMAGGQGSVQGAMAGGIAALAGAVNGQGGAGVNQPQMMGNVADEAQRIAAMPKGTHPALPERRDSKVPAELKSFGNGKVPASQLEAVGVKDHQLWTPAAKAFKMMRAAAKRDGVQIGVNSSYRDVACQQCMVDKYGLYSQGGRAAAPGKSNHGWGLSIDLQLDASAKKWMRENAKYYGFVEDVAREPWHWTFVAKPDAVKAP